MLTSEEIGFVFKGDVPHFSASEMMCSEEMQATKGEWGFVGAIFSGAFHIASNAVGGKKIYSEKSGNRDGHRFCESLVQYNPLPF